MGNITRLYLIRHAKTNLNSDNRYLGKTDVSLNSKGIMQAKLIKKRMEDISIKETLVNKPSQGETMAEMIRAI